MSKSDRQRGVDLFNRTWELIESREDDDLMVHCAHASAYHCAVAPECAPQNRTRSEWQLSRVYTLVGHPEPALAHAERCLQWCVDNALAGWDLAYAHEALARAHKLAGDEAAAASHVEQARAVQIADPEDREHLEADLATV